MKPILEYINIHKKASKIKATNDTIKKIVNDVLNNLGHDADLNFIDVSEVTNMNYLFSYPVNDARYIDLNPDVSQWDVSNVKAMMFMFQGCENFNCDISQWNTRSCQNMNRMFYGCKEFNQDLSNWDVSNVKYCEGMFDRCEKFNSDISGWDVSNVEDMYEMFYGCKEFNQDLSGWNVSNVEDYIRMFEDCPIEEEYKPKFKL